MILPSIDLRGMTPVIIGLSLLVFIGMYFNLKDTADKTTKGMIKTLIAFTIGALITSIYLTITTLQ